jgi:cubilin
MVSFRMFNLQDTEFCNGDYLEIRTNDGGGELLGHFCGTGFLPSNITASNKLWIKFRSDDDSTAPGFIADYSLRNENFRIFFFFFSIHSTDFLRRSSR